jgi:ribose 5-phosphate isomerase B
MKVALGADHGEFELKEHLKKQLLAAGHEVTDFGVDTEKPVDYPEYAMKVARGVGSGDFDRGVLCCGSGIGMSIAANKCKGVRAALIYTEELAKLSRAHNDANVLCLGGRFTTPEEGESIVNIWMTEPCVEDRHKRRVHQISECEAS